MRVDDEGRLRATERPSLTDREQEILVLVALGFRNSDIGSTLYISMGTVKHDLSSIFRRFGFTCRAHAVLSLLESRTLLNEEGEPFSLEDFVDNNAVKGIETLTQRQHEVIQALISDSGRASSNKEIGRKLWIRPKTVRAHIGRIFAKLGVKDRV